MKASILKILSEYLNDDQMFAVLNYFIFLQDMLTNPVYYVIVFCSWAIIGFIYFSWYMNKIVIPNNQREIPFIKKFIGGPLIWIMAAHIWFINTRK